MNESDLIAAIFSSRENFDAAVASGITAKDFRHPFARLCMEAGDFFMDNGVEPNLSNLGRYIEDAELSQSRRMVFIRMARDLDVVDTTTADYDFAFFLKKKKEQEFSNKLADAFEVYSTTGDMKQTIEALDDVTSIASDTVRFDNMFDVFTDEGAERLHLARRADIEGAGRRLKLDEHMDFLHEYWPRGIPKATITAVTAPTGVGKSLLTANLLNQAVKSGLISFYVVTENREVEAGTRVQAICSGIQFNQFDDMGFSREASFQFSQEKGYGKVIMWKVPISSISANMIDEAMRYAEHRFGVTFDALFIDSPEHMIPNAHADGTWRDQAKVVYNIKKLIDEDARNLICIITYQLTADAVEKNYTFAEAMAGSKERGRTVDNVIQMYEKEGDKLISAKRLKVTKLRNGKGDGFEHMLMVHANLVITRFDFGAPAAAVEGVTLRRRRNKPEPEPDVESHDEEVSEEKPKKKYGFAGIVNR